MAHLEQAKRLLLLALLWHPSRQHGTFNPDFRFINGIAFLRISVVSYNG